MATYVIFITEFCRNFDILNRQKYFRGSKERSEKLLVLVVFKRTQRYNYVMSLSSVITENSPHPNRWEGYQEPPANSASANDTNQGPLP